MGINWDRNYSKRVAWKSAAAIDDQARAQVENVYRAEDSYNLLMANLGRDGTWESLDSLGQNTGPLTAGDQTGKPGSQYYPGGLFDARTPSEFAGSLAGPQGSSGLDNQFLLNPNKVLDWNLKSPMYRLLSSEVRKADQLARGEGDEYEKMRHDVLDPIITGSALQNREAARQLIDARRASGGAAAGVALNASQLLLEQQNMTARNAAISNANLQFDAYRSENARNTLAFAQDWLSNQPGVRQAFTSNLLAAGNSAVSAYNAAATLHTNATLALPEIPKRSTAKLIAGIGMMVVGAAASIYGYGGGSLLSTGSNLAFGASPDPSRGGIGGGGFGDSGPNGNIIDGISAAGKWAYNGVSGLFSGSQLNDMGLGPSVGQSFQDYMGGGFTQTGTDSWGTVNW